MGRSFSTARNALTVPQVQSIRYATGQVFKHSALLVDNAAGEVIECGADPVSIIGVSMEGAGTKLGYGASNPAETTVVTGRVQEVSVALANRIAEFSGRGVNGGTDPVIPLQTHVGEQYGVAKVGDDWVIDLAETAVKSVEITDIEPDGNFFLFKFLEAALARP